jgi:hypothetical protein
MLSFSPESEQRLLVLMAKTETDSRAEVVANALRLYEALIERVQANLPLYERTQNGEYVEYQVFRE